MRATTRNAFQRERRTGRRKQRSIWVPAVVGPAIIESMLVNWIVRAMLRATRWLGATRLTQLLRDAIEFFGAAGSGGSRDAQRDSATTGPQDRERQLYRSALHELPGARRATPYRSALQEIPGARRATPTTNSQSTRPRAILERPLSLMRQKTVNPMLLEQLGDAFLLLQSIGLDLGDGHTLPPSSPVRNARLCNRTVFSCGQDLLIFSLSAVTQLAAVGYTECEVRRMLALQFPTLSWLGECNLASIRLKDHPNGTAQQLKARLSKWCALRSKLNGRTEIQSRKAMQMALIERLRTCGDSLGTAVQIGVAEAEDDLCAICFARPRTVVLQHQLRRAEDRHQVCEPCLASLMQSNARCPFCNETVTYG